METLDKFVDRLARTVGCFSHPCNSGIISLKKQNTTTRGNMGVFGWVRELKRTNRFEVSSYKDRAERAGVHHLADGERSKMHWNDTGIFFFVKKGSTGEDFHRAVKALRSILQR